MDVAFGASAFGDVLGMKIHLYKPQRKAILKR
jgi:hypothetical protein